MTGNNHYPWCDCGWCMGGGNRSGGNIGPSLRRQSGQIYRLDQLRKIWADRCFSACYVNPNAFCPVCRAPVYFYQNSSGSKVFFDELGWPWPKHACTDRQKFPLKPEPILNRKRDRALTTQQDLRIEGIDIIGVFEERYTIRPLPLLRVDGRINGEHHYIYSCSYIYPYKSEPVMIISVKSESYEMEVGSYINYLNSEVCYMNDKNFEKEKNKAMLVTIDEIIKNNSDRTHLS